MKDWKCGEMLANPLRSYYDAGSGEAALNPDKSEVFYFDTDITTSEENERWKYGSHQSYDDDDDVMALMTGSEHGDLDQGWYIAYDALTAWAEWSSTVALPSFSCTKSQYSASYLGESCDINADCKASLGLSCAYNDEDDSDRRIKTCIETARCYTDIPGDESAWYVCDSAIKIALSAAMLLTVTVSSM